jgi:hypothetical protein
LEKGKDIRKIVTKVIVFTGLAVLLIIILWSVVTETLLPLYRNRQLEELTYNAFGIPVILIGTGIFVYGGWVFYRDSRNLFYDPNLINNADLIRNKNEPKEKIKIARSENTKMLFSTWKKGAFWLLIGAVLITGGGFVINLKKILE